MNNMELYNIFRVVPTEAKKEIKGGRLAGFTDINPMWRIKTLTEQFGVCGFGWYYEILEEKIEEGANGEKVAFVKINLYIKQNDEWSKPIQGTGGSSFIAKERNGLYTSDECFKMALTDAISVSCKALGIGADVYFNKDRSKYDTGGELQSKAELSEAQVKRLFAIASKKGFGAKQVKEIVLKKYKVTEIAKLARKQYDEAIAGFEGLEDKAGK